MESVETFKEFLQNKRSENKRENWDARRKKWVGSVNGLYAMLNDWLRPYVDENLIDVRLEKDVVITEDYIGTYSLKRFDIYLGSDLVSLTPKGTMILGSFGRIDMVGSKGEVMLVQPKWNDWKLARRTPSLETWNLTEASFTDALKNIV